MALLAGGMAFSIVDLFNLENWRVLIAWGQRDMTSLAITLAAGLVFVLLIRALMARFMRLVVGRSDEPAKSRAKRKDVVHETGVGTREAIILRQNAQLWRAGLFALLFFGGGGLFLLSNTDWSSATSRDYFGTGANLAFGLVSLVLISTVRHRVIITDESIDARLFRSTHGRWAQLSDVKPLAKTYRSGVKLVFTDGREVRIQSSMRGYADFLRALQRHNPKFAMLARMGLAL